MLVIKMHELRVDRDPLDSEVELTDVVKDPGSNLCDIPNRQSFWPNYRLKMAASLITNVPLRALKYSGQSGPFIVGL